MVCPTGMKLGKMRQIGHLNHISCKKVNGTRSWETPYLIALHHIALLLRQYGLERVTHLSRPILVLNGIDYARFVNTSVQFRRYRYVSLYVDRFDSSVRSIWNRSAMSFEYARHREPGKANSSRLVRGVGILSDQIVDHCFAQFTCISTQRCASKPPKLPGARGFV